MTDPVWGATDPDDVADLARRLAEPDRPAALEEAHLHPFVAREPVPLGPVGTEALGPSIPGKRPGDRDSRYGQE